MSHARDDRIETRGYAVKRLLSRWGHCKPSRRWGPAPEGRAERERWVRAHRKSVQRRLDDLQAAGLLSAA